MKLYERLDVFFRQNGVFKELFNELKEGASVQGAVENGESFIFKKLKSGFFIGPDNDGSGDISFSVSSGFMDLFLASEFKTSSDIKDFIESESVDFEASNFKLSLNSGLIKLTQKGYLGMFKKLDYSLPDIMKKSLRYISGNGRKLWQKKMF